MNYHQSFSEDIAPIEPSITRVAWKATNSVCERISLQPLRFEEQVYKRESFWVLQNKQKICIEATNTVWQEDSETFKNFRDTAKA